MAAITQVKITSTDIGTEATPGGFNPVAEVTVSVSGVVGDVLLILNGTSELRLTPTQVTNMQNQVNILRTKAVTLAKAAFDIP